MKSFTFLFAAAVIIIECLLAVASASTANTHSPRRGNSSRDGGSRDGYEKKDRGKRGVSVELFDELDELSRLVDIAYCVGLTGIHKPFKCLSHCSEFEGFELVKTWNTGPLFSDSCGYIALSHHPSAKRIIVAFRGTYSITNTIVDLSAIPQPYVPYPLDNDGGTRVKCLNCTVHAGFLGSWRNTRPIVLSAVLEARARYPDYQVVLVGHSLGGAVAALAGLEMQLRGLSPQVTTFGEPRIGNQGLALFIDKVFNLTAAPPIPADDSDDQVKAYRRVTHTNDPVPLLPLQEWGYRMHAGEIYISKLSLPPTLSDVAHCEGDADPQCIAGADQASLISLLSSTERLSFFPHPQVHGQRPSDDHDEELRRERLVQVSPLLTQKQKALSSHPTPSFPIDKKGDGVREESIFHIIPVKLRLWELFFAHRDYFWRLGLCVPGGDPGSWR